MNLLPRHIQEKLRRDSFFRFLGAVCVVISISALIGIGTLLAPYLLIHSRMVDLTAEIRNSAALFLVPKTTELQKIWGEVGAMMRSIVPTSPLSPTETFRKIIAAKPVGVKIVSFSYAVKTEKNAEVSVLGIASGRNEILSFMQRLQAEKSFTNVNVPVSNFAKGENIEFSLTLTEAINENPGH